MLKNIFLGGFILLQSVVIHVSHAGEMEKGNSAFLYGKNNSWIVQIKKYNSLVPDKNRINYLFPLAGKAIPDRHEMLQVTYDPTATLFYKSNLSNIKILSNISFKVKNAHFEEWSEKNYIKAADSLSEIIIKDPSVDGVHLDIETYSNNMLPFYKRLSGDLNKHGKIVALFASSKDISTRLSDALGENAIIVLYGYDLNADGDGSLPVSPEIYQKRLDASVHSALTKIKNSGSNLMIGIPAVATVHEWEYKMTCLEDRCSTVKSGYSQDLYFSKALDLVHNLKEDKYAGYVIWAFVANKKNQEFLPLDISKAEWDMMITAGRN